VSSERSNAATVMTQRDARGLRAQVRRFAHETGCEEFAALVEHCERLGSIWTFRVTRLHDAWHGSLHTERYRLDFWGPPPLVDRVFGIVQRELFS
jgi:hypothetical protein